MKEKLRRRFLALLSILGLVNAIEAHRQYFFGEAMRAQAPNDKGDLPNSTIVFGHFITQVFSYFNKPLFLSSRDLKSDTYFKSITAILLVGGLVGCSGCAAPGDGNSVLSKVTAEEDISTSADNAPLFKSTDLQEATFVSLSAREAKKLDLVNVLTQSAGLVAKNEPNTKLWYALNAGGGEYAIFDVFPNQSGRTEHFEGQATAALKNKASDLVEDGWERGVVKNMRHYTILSKKIPQGNQHAELASYVTLKAAPGKAEALAGLLRVAGDIITETEPGTVFWASMQLNDDTFAIFDTFSDRKAREAHFSGVVMEMLESRAEAFIQGGWEQGVLNNLQHFIVQAEK